MSRRVAFFDTSLLCCWLKVPGKEQAGTPPDMWDADRVDALVQALLRERSTMIMPFATIIETGNHIAQATRDRFTCATEFARHLRHAAQSEYPWAAFMEQADLWKPERMLSLAEEWPRLAAARISLGDATIKDVANYYAAAGCEVTILTADAGLRAYQPARPVKKPRRRL